MVEEWFKEIYSKGINESNELEWIKDVKSNQDIAQEMADKTEIKDDRLYSPFSFFINLTSSYPHPLFFTYSEEHYGVNEEEIIKDIWERYRKIINDRMNSINESNESNELQWIENTSPSLVDELDFALEGSNFHAYLHPQLNTIDIINQYRNVVYRVGYNSATSRRPIRTIGEFYQAVKDGFGSSHNARLSIYPDAMDDLKTLLREYIYKKMLNESDMDWIKKVPTESRVTLDNWYIGMKVKLNPNSIFGHQSSGTGIIIDNDYYMGWCDNDDEMSDEECGWIRVGWENNELGFEGNYQNEYRIGPHRHDLLIDLDDINESDDMEWIDEVSTGIEVGACFRYEYEALVIEKIVSHWSVPDVNLGFGGHPTIEHTSIKDINSDDYKTTTVYLRNQSEDTSGYGYIVTIGLDRMVRELENGELIMC